MSKELLQKVVDWYDKDSSVGGLSNLIDEIKEELAKPTTPTELVEKLKTALEKIATLNPSNDSTEGYNEWGEADCFNQAQAIAWDALIMN
jgi:hypothetical protein